MGGQGGGKKRKANPGVGIDFKRVKHKVGKKLPKAQNDTDVSFRARSISLPGQRLGEDKGVATNSHNLTLKELLHQVSHYSDKSRKSALSGLIDFFSRHPAEAKQHASELIPVLSERIADVEQPVRAELRTLLRTAVLPRIGTAALRPFVPVLMAHICGAMTHHALEIRMDALKFLDDLMDHSPQLVVTGYLAPCLSHFCTLLSQNHRGRSIKGQSVASLHKVLTALSSFLHRAFPAPVVSSKAPGPASPSTAGRQADSHCVTGSSTLWDDRCCWPPGSIAGATGSDGQSLGGGPKGQGRHSQDAAHGTAAPSLSPAVTAVIDALLAVSSNQKGSVSTASSAAAAPAPGGHSTPVKKASVASTAPSLGAATDATGGAARLLVLLFECWTECAPSQLALSPDLQAVQALLLLMTCANVLLRQLLLNGPGASYQQAQQDVAVLQRLQHVVIRRVAPHFPATAPSVKPTLLLANALVQYNLAAVQLLGTFLPLAALDRNNTRHEALLWYDILAQYCIGVLDYGVLLPEHGMLSEAPALAAIGQVPTSTYEAVLNAVAAAVPLVNAQTASALMGAVARLTERLPARSAVRGACMRMQHSLMGEARQGRLLLDEQQVSSWLRCLPKLLWELGHANTAMSEVALRMLHDAARFSRPGSPLAAAVAALQPQLAPLLLTQFPAKSAKKPTTVAAASASAAGVPAASSAKATGCPACARVAIAADAAASGRPTLLEGPLCRLPQPLVELTLDVVRLLEGPLDTVLLHSLLAVCLSAVFPEEVSVRAVETLLTRAGGGCNGAAALPLSLLSSALLTLLFSPDCSDGGAAAGTMSHRRLAVTRTACLLLELCAPACGLLRVIEPHLLGVLHSPEPGPEPNAQLSSQPATSSGSGVATAQYALCSTAQQYSALRLAHLAALEQARGIDQPGGGGGELQTVCGTVPGGLQALWDALPGLVARCGIRQLRLLATPPARHTAPGQPGSDEAQMEAVLEACLDLLAACPTLVVPTLEAVARACHGSCSQPPLWQEQHVRTCQQRTHAAALLLAQRVLQSAPLRGMLLAEQPRVQGAVQAVVCGWGLGVEDMRAQQGVSVQGVSMEQEALPAAPSAVQFEPSAAGLAEGRRLLLMADDLFGVVRTAGTYQLP